MSSVSDNILLNIFNNEFMEFKRDMETQRKNKDDRYNYNDDDDNDDNSSKYDPLILSQDMHKIHSIQTNELCDGAYFLVACTQQPYDEIKWSDFEVWKVYTTEKYHHVVEYSNDKGIIKEGLLHMLKMMSGDIPQDIPQRDAGKPPSIFDYKLYNYFDYQKDYSDTYLWRCSSEVIGIKLPDEFSIR